MAARVVSHALQLEDAECRLAPLAGSFSSDICHIGEESLLK